MKVIIMNCFCCNKSLNHELDEYTIWITHGNYGSKIFDPIANDEILEIRICDSCLLSYRNKKNLKRFIVTNKIIRKEIHSEDLFRVE